MLAESSWAERPPTERSRWTWARSWRGWYEECSWRASPKRDDAWSWSGPLLREALIRIPPGRTMPCPVARAVAMNSAWGSTSYSSTGLERSCRADARGFRACHGVATSGGYSYPFRGDINGARHHTCREVGDWRVLSKTPVGACLWHVRLKSKTFSQFRRVKYGRAGRPDGAEVRGSNPRSPTSRTQDTARSGHDSSIGVRRRSTSVTMSRLKVSSHRHDHADVRRFRQILVAARAVVRP